MTPLRFVTVARLFYTTALAALFLDITFSGARAQATFTGADSNLWSDPNNWSTGNVPGSSDAASITFGQSVEFDYSSYSSGNGINSLTVDTGGSLTMNNQGYELFASGNEAIGNNGNGEIDQSSGTNEGSQIYLGVNPGSTGTYNLSGDGILQIDQGLYVSYSGNTGSGTGSFTQTGDSMVTGNLIGVSYGGGPGTYNFESGSINVNVENVGSAGDFNQSGGTNTASALSVGGNNGGGTYELGTESQIIAGSIGVTGTFTQTGGKVTAGSGSSGSGIGIAPGLTVDGGFGSNPGQYKLQGGTIDSTSEIVGYGSSGDFDQTGGTNSAGALDLGLQGPSVGTYELSGGSTSTLEADSETIGDEGTGTFTHSDAATNTVTGALIVGNQAGSVGTYSASNGAQIQAGSVQIAVAPADTADGIPASKGTMTLDGSATYLEADTLSVGGSPSSPGGTGLFKLTGGATANVSTKVTSGPGGTIDVTGGSLTVGSGSTQAAMGTILVNSGGTLGGGGMIVGSVVNGGTVTPGDPTTTSITGDYTQTSAGSLVLAIGGSNVTDNDHLTVSGEFSVAMGAKLVLDFINGVGPQPGQGFDLITYGSLDPDSVPFSDIEVEGLPVGYHYDFTVTSEYFDGTEGTTLADVSGVVTDVPEPSTDALFLLGGGLLAWAQRRRVLARSCQG